MNLEGILYISGKTGLFKIVSKGKNTIIAESLNDGKRAPIYSSAQANMLEEIGIYTYDDTISLSEIFDEISKKENTQPTISHKSSKEELINYFRAILPEYDEERVYISDIKKVVQWYNTMQKVGLIESPVKKEEKKKKKKKEKEKENIDKK